MTLTRPSSSVLWLQVWGLAAMQGAIALLWVIYNLYLPSLLELFGFSAAFATGLVILENVLSGVMEPLIGNFSDRTQRWVGSRFPFITVGVLLSSAPFLGIPALVVFRVAGLKWVFAGVVVAWALAMTIFRSPALSLLGRYAFATQLPQAASILTLFGAIAGALAPFSSQYILQLGAPITFGLGALVLLVAAAVLRFVHAPLPPDQIEQTAPIEAISLRSLALVFGTGMGVAIGFRMMMQLFPQVLKTQVGGANPSFILGLIFVAIACTALPAGTLAVRLGNRRAMLFGFAVMSVGLALLPLVHNGAVAAIFAIGLGSAFSLVSNGTIPFALCAVPPAKVGLGTGMFFGGGAIGVSLFLSLFAEVSLGISGMVGAIAWIAAASCVALATQSTST